jgi:hypothetical protein
MSSSAKPCLRRQAFTLTGRAMNVPRPYVRAFRRVGYLARYMRAFMWTIAVNPKTIFRKTERTIIWGKIRRTIIVCVPGLASHLKRKYGLSGACISCGASCNLLLKCPHWNEGSRLCSIYDDRPLTCRLFPITPSDIRDRELVSNGNPCGYSFVPSDSPWERSRKPDNERLIVLQPATAGHQDPRQVMDSRRMVRSSDAAD